MNDSEPFKRTSLNHTQPALQVLAVRDFGDSHRNLIPRLDPERKIAVVPLGALDDDPGVRPVDNIFVAYKAGWHDITDALPAFAEWPQ